ncbi:MAG: hypothetical protein AAGJ87_03860, partial [Pseudomonadota bacterium]
VLRDGAPLRVIEVSTPGFVYLFSDIAADFGADSAGHPTAESLEFAVRQWSDRVGWGSIGARGPN